MRPQEDELTRLTATELVAATSAGRVSCVEVATACLARIDEREADVAAWAHVDAERVLAEARALDRRADRGPLHGVPFAVKDIIDVHGLPTGHGSPIHEGHRATRDAACVALSRRAGALPLGKAVTPEFANVGPVRTRNPHDASRTPGGSSSGSAAAVGDRMAPLGLGTQTTGSTIRPASFCGIVGYRPTLGDLSLSGVLDVSASLDTLGLLARSVDDVALHREVLLGRSADTHAPVARTTPPRIGVVRPYYWDRIEDSTRARFDALEERLADAGASLSEATLPEGFEVLEEAHRWISGFEMAHNLTWELDNHVELLSAPLRDGRLADGLACSYEHYRRCKEQAARARAELEPVFDRFDVLLTPAAAGEAPTGPDPVPHPWLYKPWSALHVPCVTVPVLEGPQGLPIGAQLVGRWGADADLLAAARWLEGSVADPVVGTFIREHTAREQPG